MSVRDRFQPNITKNLPNYLFLARILIEKGNGDCQSQHADNTSLKWLDDGSHDCGQLDIKEAIYWLALTLNGLQRQRKKLIIANVV